MQVRTGIFFGSLMLLAGCAVPVPPAPRVAVAPVAAEHGTILAIHRVTPEDSQAARVLREWLGDQAGAQAQRVEYIVRVQGGATIAGSSSPGWTGCDPATGSASCPRSPGPSHGCGP
jgi:hypothetical protein